MKRFVYGILALVATLNLFLAAPLVYAASQSFNPTANTQWAEITGSGINPGAVNTMTVEGWVKFVGSVPSVAGDCIALVNKWGTSNATDVYEFDFEVFSGLGHLNFAVNSGGGSNGQFVNWSPSSDTWYHIKTTYNAGSVKFFVSTDGNDVQQGTTQTGSNLTINNVSTTAYVAENGQHFLGCPNTSYNYKVSLARVWSTDRSANSDGCTVYSGAQSGLVTQWTLNNSLLDTSGNSNTLTNTGSTAFSADTPACINFGGTIIFNPAYLFPN